MKRALVLMLVVTTAAGPAAAHEQQLHQELTTMAYEIMRLVERTPTSFLTPPVPLPTGTTIADFNAFRAEVIAAAPKLRAMPTGLASLGRNCIVARGPVPPGTTLTAGFDQWPTLSQVNEPLSWTYPDGIDCGIFPAWAPSGVYAGFTPGVPGVDHTGLTLGMLASAPDDEIDDTHLWYRPTHWGPPTPGFPLSDRGRRGTGQRHRPRDRRPPRSLHLLRAVADRRGELPGRGQRHRQPREPRGRPGGSAARHRRPHRRQVHGLLAPHQRRARPVEHVRRRPGHVHGRGHVGGRLDAAEIAATIAADVTGEGIHHRPSNGPARYQVRRGRDGHPDTVMRGESEWQFLNWPHTPMAPLDNLALFGWERYRADPATSSTARQARWLAWPLHALGDAAAPHHVIGAPGWGHRPMEIAVNRAWNAIRFVPTGRALTPADILTQRTQARRIFTLALRWRKLIRDWRAADSVPRAQNLPIRDMVTELARDTYAHAMGTMATEVWPFEPIGSAANFLDESQLSGHDRANLPALARPLLENSVAAKLAFLTFATEVQ